MQAKDRNLTQAQQLLRQLVILITYSYVRSHDQSVTTSNAAIDTHTAHRYTYDMATHKTIILIRSCREPCTVQYMEVEYLYIP